MLLLVLVCAAPAHAADPRRSKLLWATVNVCDTEQSPNTIGIRGSMPGSGRKGETMWMRFRVQYFSEREGIWHNFTSKGADSGALRVGLHARYRARQSGYLFPFDPPAGTTYRLRGAVYFQWRRGKRIVRRVKKVTTAGRAPTVADPKGFSAATCDVVG